MGQLEQLEQRVRSLIQTSKDIAFTEYLRQMLERIAGQQRQIGLLSQELEQRVRMYENRMRAMQQTQAAQQLPSQPVPQQAPQAPQAPQAVFSQPVTQETQTVLAQPVPQPAPQPQPTPQKVGGNAEFVVGAAVLSIVGGIFILTALVLLGMYFMAGVVKGLMLYGVCALVMVLAEMVLYRRFPKLGMTLSAIGMGGLYISTLINYLALKNFNQWVTLGVTILITAVVILLSRKRDAAAYRILGMVAVYVCILTVPVRQADAGSLSQMEFVTMTAMAFIVNLMCLAVPVRKGHTAISITHMALNTIFTLWAYLAWIDGSVRYEGIGEMWQYPAFVALSILVTQMLFAAQIRWRERQTPGGGMAQNVGICVTYCIVSPVYVVLAAFATDFYDFIDAAGASVETYLPYRLACSAVAVVLCLIPMLALRKRQEKWFAWYLMNLLVFAIHIGSAGWELSICLVVLLVVSKLLSFAGGTMLCISDAVVTTFVCLAVLINKDLVYAIPLFVGLLLSVLCVNYWKTYFEVILTFTIALYTAGHMLVGLKLPVFVGILFVGMLIFNNVKRWHGRGIVTYNVMALSGQAICFLLLVNPVYRNAYLTYLCMLVFGVATIVVCFQKHYHLDFKYKQLILAVFLTYMGLIVRTSYSIVNSILLMMIALLCVGMGFAIRQMSVRIYGLVLSLTVCAKIVLYDFMGANMLQKTILFFVVGVLALVIAAIYMVLERLQMKRGAAAAVSEQ